MTDVMEVLFSALNRMARRPGPEAIAGVSQALRAFAGSADRELVLNLESRLLSRQKEREALFEAILRAPDSAADFTSRFADVAHEIGDAAILLFVEESVDTLVTHFEAGRVALAEVVIHLLGGEDPSLPGRVAVRVYHNDRWGDVPRRLWDRREIASDHPLLAAIALSEFAPVKIAFGSPAAWEASPMFAYHPERYRQTRPHAGSVTHIVKGAAEALVYNSDFERLKAQVKVGLNETCARFPLRACLKYANEPGSLRANVELNLAAYFAAYAKAGRQIFQLPQALVDQLRQTDASDVPVQMIRAPYKACYIHFGRQADLEFADGWCVDGVYVRQPSSPEGLCLSVTCAPPSVGSGRSEWAFRAEPSYTLDFIGESYGLDVGAAIDLQVSSLVNDLQKIVDDAPAEIRRLAVEQPNVVYRSGEGAEIRLAYIKGCMPALRAAISLAVNALCYLTAYPDDIAAGYPESAPEDLRQQFSQGDASTSQRAKRSLDKLGFSEVRIAGQRLLRQSGESAGDGDGERATHWRRGHWRRQPFGPGRMLRKLVWVMPVLVGAGSEDENAPGHVYLVD